MKNDPANDLTRIGDVCRKCLCGIGPNGECLCDMERVRRGAAETVVVGRCILDGPGSSHTAEQAASCVARISALAAEYLEHNRDASHARLLALVGEVRRYLERPGCNIPARQTAMARLRWAADQAMEQP